jgi:hypothetical protein
VKVDLMMAQLHNLSKGNHHLLYQKFQQKMRMWKCSNPHKSQKHQLKFLFLLRQTTWRWMWTYQCLNLQMLNMLKAKLRPKLHQLHKSQKLQCLLQLPL